jgi:hypothetical protein
MDAILKMPPFLRHLVLLVLGVVIMWGGTDLVPFLQDQSNVLGGLAAAVVTAFLAWLTPLVSSYGVGAERARELGARTPEQAAGRTPGV